MKKARSPKNQGNKANYLTHAAFTDLKQALDDALAFERGERGDLGVTRIQAPRPAKAISPKVNFSHRQKLKCSQTVFAMMLNIGRRPSRLGSKVEENLVTPQSKLLGPQQELAFMIVDLQVRA